MINDLKQKADITYKEMNNKLGDRYIRENNSITHLCNFIKYCIETKQRIKREIQIDQDEFMINDVEFSLFTTLIYLNYNFLID